MTTVPAQIDDFDVSKAVFEQLKGLPPERQQRVLRWVSEGLGVALPYGPMRPEASGGSPFAGAMAPGAGSGVDLRTFVLAKSPRSDNQFAAVVAYYYRFEAPFADRRDTIEGGVLQTAARLVGRKRLNNPRSTLNNAKASGYLDGVTPGEFAINGVGEKLVVRSLPTGDDDIVRPVRQRKAATRTETRGTPRRKTI